MFFTLSKTLDILASPLFWALVLASLAAYAARRGRAGRAWKQAGASALLLYLFSVPLVAGPLFNYLERHDGRAFREDETYDGVIVLGGFLGGDQDGRIALTHGADRLLRGFELLHEGQAKSGFVIAGGSSDLVEADLAAYLLETWGIAKARLVLGRSSLNTRENAQELKRLLAGRKLAKLVLVTSAFHMQRALDCMRAVGLEPDVLPCDYQSPWTRTWYAKLVPRAGTLAQSELALRELLGRAVYRLLGYSKARASE